MNVPPLPSDPQALLDRFDALPAVGSAELQGEWRGFGVPSGHPLDGVLEALGWHGKRFVGEDAHPLLFAAGGAVFAVNPAPLALAPGLLRGPLPRPVLPLLRRALPLFRTARPAARLHTVQHRGVTGAAMVYDALPVVDHFRRSGAGELLGLMQLRGSAPFFFGLRREG